MIKKRFSLALAAVLFVGMLSACGNSQPGGEVWQQTPTAPQTNERLTVFCMGDQGDSKMISLALNRFRELYPEIEVELIKPEVDATDYEAQEAQYKQVAAQIMAGEGPDVFVINDRVMDVEKLVRQGVFADMEPFFQEDGFAWSPYNQAVMDGGVWNGKRFVIPLSYDFPLLFTTRTALEETGFDVGACGDYQGFLEETTRYMADSAQTRQLFRYALFLTEVADFSGIPIADYDARTADLSSPVLEQGLRWYKTVMEENPMTPEDGTYSLEVSAAAVRDGQVLWTPSMLGAMDGFYNIFPALKTVDEVVMLPIRDVNGGIQAKIQYPVAVRGNSENLQNAYAFLKILLSSEIQCKFSYGQSLSVLNAANEYAYQEISQGRVFHIAAGAAGFYSTVSPNEGGDWPSQEEYQQFAGFTQEITGAYYRGWNLEGAMYAFVFENADYGETLKEAQRKLELYITE